HPVERQPVPEISLPAARQQEEAGEAAVLEDPECREAGAHALAESQPPAEPQSLVEAEAARTVDQHDATARGEGMGRDLERGTRGEIGATGGDHLEPGAARRIDRG